MKNKLTLLIAPAILSWCFFYLQGCKEPLIEETDLLTIDDNLSLAKDTLHTKVFTLYQDALESYGVSAGVLGTVTDVNFGNSYASLYAQCGLSSNNITFGDGKQLDSVVLTLRYLTTYGKFTQPLTVAVYEVTDNMVDSFKYKTNDAFSVAIPPIGTLNNWIPNLTDSVSTLQGNVLPHLRVTLNKTFGEKILLADSLSLVDNTAFRQLFKGFYITTAGSPTGNGIANLDLASTVTGITLYYHNNAEDSLSFRLPVSGVTVNHFDNVYSGSPVATSVSNPNPAGEEQMYIQGGAGTKGKILITDLDSLPKNIAINKAEIIFSQRMNSTDTAYNAPELLDLFRIDDAGQAQGIDDDGLTGFGGVLTAETVNGETVYRYRFNIKKYFQKLVQGVYNNNGFLLQVYRENVKTERVVIANSSTDSKYQITVEVTYTRL